MVTPVSKLPSFNGRPVPWITRWTGEVHPDRFDYGVQVAGDVLAGEFSVTYEDGKNIRDGRGILWQREGIGRRGEPMYADVSTYRQRAAMKKRLCQVCGSKITDNPTNFLIPLVAGMEQFDENTTVTMQAPVCEGCVPLAIRMCPALKREGYQHLKVLAYRAWGVFGQVTYPTPQGFQRMQGTVGYDESYGDGFNFGHVLAQQQVVQLEKYVVVDTHHGTQKPTKVSVLDAMFVRPDRPITELHNELADTLIEEARDAQVSAPKL